MLSFGRSHGIFLAALAVGVVGLLLHAWSYGFVCDDAFITFRYARNLIEHGLPVYNLAERTEGYTSPLWMVLVALGIAMGVPVVVWVKWLGAFFGAALVVASGLFFRTVLRARLPNAWADWLVAWLLMALVSFAPVAAWTMGGLENPLYAAAVMGVFALSMDFFQRPTRARASLTGACLALAALSRPEGFMLFFIVIVAMVYRLKHEARSVQVLSCCVVTFAVPVGLHVIWRLSFYGALLPNTFYVKSTGFGLDLYRQGLRYLELFAWDVGWWWVILGLIGAVIPWGRSELAPRASRSLRIMVILWLGGMVAYLVSIGGDFLDLYRFMIPLLPLVLLLAMVALVELAARLKSLGAAVWLPLMLGVLAVHVTWQVGLRERALQVAEPSRADLGIEPLGWTRLYAPLWSASGRWIGHFAEPGDWMATGAAGAMPFYAGIASVDLFGLNDRFVALHGDVVGSRPGHQRWAPWEYTLSKQPVFLMVQPDTNLLESQPLRHDAHWYAKGYVWAEAVVDRDVFFAPVTSYQRFLLRRDRAQQWQGRPYLRIAPLPR